MRGSLRKLFTDKEVISSIEISRRTDGTINYVTMSKVLNVNNHGTVVSPELCLYWAKQFKDTNKNGTNRQTLAQANKEIKNSRILREPKLEDYDAINTRSQTDNSSVLVIPDLHAPYNHPDAIAFLSAVADKINPDRVINLGDETDKHALSFHNSDPNLDSAGMELEKSIEFMSELHDVFPNMELCHSNHGSLAFRKAKAHGIPVQYLKDYREVLFPNGEGKGWSWHEDIIVDLPNGESVLFRHEPQGPVLSAAAHEGMNVACGHLHGLFGVAYSASSRRTYWGLNSGCLIDPVGMAFAYGKNFKTKPILGCSAIIDSLPVLFPMRLDSDGRWTGEL